MRKNIKNPGIDLGEIEPISYNPLEEMSNTEYLVLKGASSNQDADFRFNLLQEEINRNKLYKEGKIHLK